MPSKTPTSSVEMVSNIDPNSIIQCAEKFGLCLDGSIEDTMDAIVGLEIERDVRGLNSMEIMFLRNSRMHSKDSVQHGQSFKPRHDDVFITT